MLSIYLYDDNIQYLKIETIFVFRAQYFHLWSTKTFQDMGNKKLEGTSLRKKYICFRLAVFVSISTLIFLVNITTCASVKDTTFRQLGGVPFTSTNNHNPNNDEVTTFFRNTHISGPRSQNTSKYPIKYRTEDNSEDNEQVIPTINDEKEIISKWKSPIIHYEEVSQVKLDNENFAKSAIVNNKIDTYQITTTPFSPAKCSCNSMHRSSVGGGRENKLNRNDCCLSKRFLVTDEALSFLSNMWESVPNLADEFRKNVNMFIGSSEVKSDDNNTNYLNEYDGEFMYPTHVYLQPVLAGDINAVNEIYPLMVNDNVSEHEEPSYNSSEISVEVTEKPVKKDKKKKKSKRSTFLKKLFFKIFDFDLDDNEKDSKHYFPVYPMMPMHYPAATGYGHQRMSPQLQHLHYHMYNKANEQYHQSSSSYAPHPFEMSSHSTFYDRKDDDSQSINASPLSRIHSPMSKQIRISTRNSQQPSTSTGKVYPMIFRNGRSAKSNPETFTFIQTNSINADEDIQDFNFAPYLPTSADKAHLNMYRRQHQEKGKGGAKVSVEVLLPRDSRDLSKNIKSIYIPRSDHVSKSVNGQISGKFQGNRMKKQQIASNLSNRYQKFEKKSINSNNLPVRNLPARTHLINMKNLHVTDELTDYVTPNPIRLRASVPDSDEYLPVPKYLFPREYETIMSNISKFRSAVNYSNLNNGLPQHVASRHIFDHYKGHYNSIPALKNESSNIQTLRNGNHNVWQPSYMSSSNKNGLGNFSIILNTNSKVSQERNNKHIYPSYRTRTPAIQYAKGGSRPGQMIESYFKPDKTTTRESNVNYSDAYSNIDKM